MKKAAKKKVRTTSVTLESLSAKLDVRFEKIDERFEKIDERFEKMDAKLDRVVDVVAALPTRSEFQELTSKVTRIEETVGKLVTAVDQLLKKVETLTVEYHVISRQMDRYDRWFKEIAEKTGIELKP